MPSFHTETVKRKDRFLTLFLMPEVNLPSDEQKLEEMKKTLTREDWEKNGPLRQAYQELERAILLKAALRPEVS